MDYIKELQRLRSIGEITSSENFKYVQRMADHQRFQQVVQENPGSVHACCGSICMSRIPDCPHRRK